MRLDGEQWRTFFDAFRRTGTLRVLFESTVSRIGRDDVVIEQNGRRLRIRNDTVIVCAGGMVALPSSSNT